MNRLLIVLVWAIGATGVVCSVLWAIGFYQLGRALEPQPWPKVPTASARLPDHAGVLKLYLRDMHPIKPQFERRIEIDLADGRRIASPIYFHFRDPTKIRLYWYEGSATGGPLLRLQDKCSQIVVDLESRRVIKRSRERPFPARIRNGPGRYFGRIVGRGLKQQFERRPKSGERSLIDWPPFDQKLCPRNLSLPRY
ncbi:MAG: hypothetical protein P8Z76_09435 [Alphaproteobacteria bacterium]